MGVRDCSDNKVGRVGRPTTDYMLVFRLWLPYISCFLTVHLYSVNGNQKIANFSLNRFIRRLQQEARETEMQQRISAAALEKEQKEKQQEQEERLAKQLEKMKWEQERDERYRQQIRENRYAFAQLASVLGLAPPVIVIKLRNRHTMPVYI